MMTLEHASASHVGRRDNNEDALCAAPELGLFAVADGMGGYAGGEVASAIVVDTLSRFFARVAGSSSSSTRRAASAAAPARTRAASATLTAVRP